MLTDLSCKPQDRLRKFDFFINFDLLPQIIVDILPGL